MRNTNKNRGIIAILLAVMFLSAAAIPAFAQPALSIVLNPDPPIQGQTLTVTSVPGADVYFVLNGGTSVYGKTNASGMVNYIPLLTGTLNITAIYKGISTSEERPIYEPYGVDLQVVDDTAKTIDTTETATYTLRVKNIGNVTDTIDLTRGAGEIGTLIGTPVTLVSGESKPVTLKVSSSSTGTYTTTVTATSRGDSSKSDSVTVTTTVKEEVIEEEEEIRRVVRGGGGGAPREPEMNVPVDPETGAVLETTLLTVDGATLTFPKGTIVKDAGGNPLATSIFMLYAPTIAESVGAIEVYDFGPAGLTFVPAIDLVIPYDPADIPAGFDESDLVVRMWDGTAWIDFVTSIDTEAHVATAEVSHFTIFGLFAAPPVAAPPVTPTPVVMPPPAVTPTPTPTPTPPVPVVPWVIVLIAIVAAVIIVAVAYVVLSRRKS